MPNARLTYLFEQYLAKTCSAEEKQELAEMILTSQDDKDVQDLMLQAWDTTEVNEIMPEEKAGEIFSSIIRAADTGENERGIYRIDRGAKVRKLWRRIAAASAVLIIGLSTYLYLNKTHQSPETAAVVVKHDVSPPAVNRATITLAGGKVVYLDSVNNGTLALQGGVSLQKLADGQIVYTGTSTAASVTYNTLNNPRGSKVIDMTLSDGSKVWLNAGSTMIYPLAFAGNERKITITGEAYFEVAHNAAMPFKVSKGGMEITVLGTHFNVNAYDDESDVRVTLLEGSIKTSIVNGPSLMVKPGQQAIVENGKLKVENGIDLDAVMAWKNGYFAFSHSDLQTVMRQVARWYDVEVVYEGAIPDMKFGGEISRNNNVSQVLKVLEESKVKFRIEGKKIVVVK